MVNDGYHKGKGTNRRTKAESSTVLKTSCLRLDQLRRRWAYGSYQVCFLRSLLEGRLRMLNQGGQCSPSRARCTHQAFLSHHVQYWVEL